MLALAMPGAAWAHVVPNMTVEADFAADGGYTLSINVDPRTFLAADPTTLPPVPGSWYREQTPEQLAATHEKAGEYLARALGLLFGGQKTPLPNCALQAIDGESNTPLTAETQEVHLLASAQGRVPAGAASFQIDFAKDANTTLILLPSHGGKAAPRPQVIFPGETSRAYPLETSTPADSDHGGGTRPSFSATGAIVQPRTGHHAERCGDASHRGVAAAESLPAPPPRPPQAPARRCEQLALFQPPKQG
jgi:hypothetical protein